MKHAPPPQRWFWFVAVVGLAVLASLTIAADHAPPPIAQAPTEPSLCTGADSRTEVVSLGSSPAHAPRGLLCQAPLY